MAGKQKTFPRLTTHSPKKDIGKKSISKLSKKPSPSRSHEKLKKRRENILICLLRLLVKGILRLIWSLLWRIMVISLAMAIISVSYFALNLPDAANLLDGRARGSVTMLDKNGEVFAWRGDQFGGVADVGTVSETLKNAIIATEDKNFYKHYGVSPRGIASAVRINLREGRNALSGHGGSTITQQTAKLLCLGVPFDKKRWSTEKIYEADCRAGSVWRKVKEAIFAIALEIRYSKDQILTIYLNRVFLGAGARGFEAAAQRYFGKSAADISLAESAMLAGLLVAPSRYAPTNNLVRSQDRAQIIIELMEKQNYISKAEAELARSQPAELSSAAAARAGGYFADWVMQSGPSFLTKNTTEDVIIKTTLDQRIQQITENSLRSVFDTRVKRESKAQAAIVVMSADGAVRAMVGGRNTEITGAFNRATQALRQTGSAFKPFIYATAFDLGYSPYDLLDDTPLELEVSGSGLWKPKNYSGEYLGAVTLIKAFSQSLNIPAVRLSEAVGRENVRNVAAGFGLTTDIAKGPAMALGVSESTLIEMTGAYAGILNGGSAVTPYGLLELRLVGELEPLMGIAGGIGERIIQENAARQLIWVMSKAVSEGTGQRAQISGWDIGAKTGTTQESRDAWFIGFTADYVTGVWMGYDDNTPLKGVTGGGLPADIWRETMSGIYGDQLPQAIPKPLFKTTTNIKKPVSSHIRTRKNAIGTLIQNLKIYESTD